MNEIYGVIYITTCLVNGKVYIGQTIHWQDKSYLGSGVALCEAVKKYGRSKFKRKILKVCYNQKQLDAWEMIMIRKYNSTDKSIGYNILTGTANNFGSINPSKIPEVKEKIRKSSIGRKLSEETKKKISLANKGQKNHMFGKHMSKQNKEMISKMAKNRLKKPENNPMFGKKHSDETKQLIREKNKGLFGIKNSNYGNRWTDEQKQKLSDKKKGVKMSEKTKDKMRINGKIRFLKPENNPMFGKIWITDGVNNKVIDKNSLIKQGWKRGRNIQKKNQLK